MSGNVQPNSGLVFPRSVCAENVTRKDRLMQSCTYFKWLHIRCSLLFCSKFNALVNCHSWSCFVCCMSAFPGDPQPSNSVTFIWRSQACISPLFILAHMPSIWQCSAPATLLPANFLLSFRPPHNSSLCTFPSFYVSGCFLFLLLSFSPLTGSRFFNE